MKQKSSLGALHSIQPANGLAYFTTPTAHTGQRPILQLPQPTLGNDLSYNSHSPYWAMPANVRNNVDTYTDLMFGIMLTHAASFFSSKPLKRSHFSQH